MTNAFITQFKKWVKLKNLKVTTKYFKQTLIELKSKAIKYTNQLLASNFRIIMATSKLRLQLNNNSFNALFTVVEPLNHLSVQYYVLKFELVLYTTWLIAGYVTTSELSTELWFLAISQKSQVNISWHFRQNWLKSITSFIIF